MRIHNLSATLQIEKSEHGKVLNINGLLTAHVIQECVITLEPVDERILVPVNQKLVRNKEKVREEVLIAENKSCYDERIEGQTVNVGEMISQCLFIELPAYPRKEGAEFKTDERDKVNFNEIGPFAKLAKLK